VAVVEAHEPVTDGAGKCINAGDKLPAGTIIRTGAGGWDSLVTRKGSEFHLDSKSELSLTSNNIATISRGRLYCSNRNKEIACIDTSAGQVKLLGTVVNTAIVRKDTVAVTVVEGKVRLENTHGSALVDAGKRSVLMAFRPPQSGISVNTYKKTAWYHGRGDYLSDFGDLAFTVKRDNIFTEIWMMKADGSGKHRVKNYIGAAEIGTWIPGERWLSIHSDSIIRSRPDLTRRIASGSSGSRIVDSQEWLLNAGTGQNQLLKMPVDYYAHYSSYSPDTIRVAFTGYYQPDQNDRSGYESGEFVYDRSTGRVTKLLSGELRTASAWAPDSRHIIISSAESHTIKHDLVIIHTDTGQIRDLHINGTGACFSPDGSKIAYCADFKRYNAWWDGVPQSGSIFVLDISPGSKPIRVSPPEDNVLWPRWSPDGARILYHGSAGLYVVNVDGSGLRQIYPCGPDLYMASWAPSGNAVFATIQKNRPDSRTLLVPADGSGKEIDLTASVADCHLPSAMEAQTKAAISAVQEAIFRYAIGYVYRFEGNIPAARESFGTVADIFASLVWSYPLSGLTTEDMLRYADAAARQIDASDNEMLENICRLRFPEPGQSLYPDR